MTVRNGHKLIQAWVPVEIAEAFESQARISDGASSAALRRLVVTSATGQKPLARGVGQGLQVGVRFKSTERDALAVAAEQRGTTPATWLRALALVHLVRRPQWNTREVDALVEISRDLRAIGRNLNQIARALNIAVQSGDYPPYQGGAAREGAVLVRHEMRRIAAIITGNYEYWGLPEDERPTAAPGAVERAGAEALAAKQQQRSRPRRRPLRFSDETVS